MDDRHIGEASVARSGVPLRPRDFLTHVLLLDCRELGVFALAELSLSWRATCPALSLPGRIPLTSGFQNPFDHISLVGVFDAGDNPHPLATALADLGGDFPDFGDTRYLPASVGMRCSAARSVSDLR